VDANGLTIGKTREGGIKQYVPFTVKSVERFDKKDLTDLKVWNTLNKIC
jgi:hypothetical protein